MAQPGAWGCEKGGLTHQSCIPVTRGKITFSVCANALLGGFDFHHNLWLRDFYTDIHIFLYVFLKVLRCSKNANKEK